MRALWFHAFFNSAGVGGVSLGNGSPKPPRRERQPRHREHCVSVLKDEIEVQVAPISACRAPLAAVKLCHLYQGEGIKR